MRKEFFSYIQDPRRLTLLTLGGSERNFYRVNIDGNKTLIYMKYTDEKEENAFYYDIYVLLKDLNINVAEVYYNENGNIFLEDLGDMHLYNLVTTSPEDKIIEYYKKVIGQLKRLHVQGELIYQKKPFKISKGFDYSLYRWESKYFLDNLLNNYFKIDISEKTLEPDFHFIADALSKEKKVLIHRDCQSKNIMVKDGQPYFIDFQGLRYGLPQYDLASLLEDPYVNLSEEMKNDLQNYYARGSASGTSASGIYRYCCIQRLMQALGAYAFLGLKKGKKEFLKYIPNGLKKLKSILEAQDDLPALKLIVYKILSL